MVGAVVRSTVAACCAALVIAWSAVSAQVEVRALWVVRTSLRSPSSVADMVAAAKVGGFNTLVVQIRGRGDAFFQQSLEPRSPALAARPLFDPLATTIAEAHAAGLRVHAWININLVAGTELPTSREHIVYRHPEWLMVPSALAGDLIKIDPKKPEYLRRLLRHARARSKDVEGLYLSPVPELAASYTIGIVRDIVTRYPVDGIHLDYIRYPEEDFDYGRETLAAFRRAIAADLTTAQRRHLDHRLQADPLIYTQAFADRWRAFRSDRVTALVSQMSATVRTVRPDALVSAAVVPDPTEAAAHRLQNWRTWVERGLVDVICPMAYTTDARLFATQITAARQIAGEHSVWAGIGAYRLSTDQIVENVQTARRVGAAGIILFSYDSLTDPPRGPGYLAELAHSAFTSQ